jgi:PAS domain S-box-containing protein
MPLLYLSIAAIPAAGLFHVRLPFSDLLEEFIITYPIAIAPLSALPWIMAGGFLGIRQAIITGFIIGVVGGGWGTHSIFTPLHLALQAGFVTWLIRCDYDDFIGKVLRHPAISAIVGGGFFGFLTAVEFSMNVEGSLTDGLGLALANMDDFLLAEMAELATAGLIAEVIRSLFPRAWFSPRWLSPGPYRRSLATKLLLAFVCLGLFSGGLIFVANWLFLRDFVQDLAAEEMKQSAIQIGSAIPDFIRTGRTLTQTYAGEISLHIGDTVQLQEDLERRINLFPFFIQLAAIGKDGNILAQTGGLKPLSELSPEFRDALEEAINGIPVQVILPPDRGQQAAQLVFLAPISLEDGAIGAVLAGWADLSVNPFMRPTFDRLQQFSEGTAYLVDDLGRIIVHPDVGRTMTLSEVEVVAANRLQVSEIDGVRYLVYSHAIAGYPWYVVIERPYATVDSLILSLSLRIFAVIGGMGLFVLAVLYGIGRQLTHPLREMAAIAESIAHGRLNKPVPITGVDEVGTLAAAFERMRSALEARLEEMDLLLLVNQQIASSLELARVMPPILDGIRELTNADMVRLVLLSAPNEDPFRECYTAGYDPGNWSDLDGQILQLSKERGHFILENPSRAQAVLNLNRLEADLEALLALPIVHEGHYWGCIWIGHREPHAFSGSERNLLSIIAGQLGIAIANARSYQHAEEDRNQLEAILEATPDAIIVTTKEGRIALANPASEGLLGIPVKEARGKLLTEVAGNPELAQWVLSQESQARTREITLEGGRALFAAMTPIKGKEQEISGNVCVLWDITRYKKLEMLKSELVSTVSHDLRKPLSLMRGYATMLSMVGTLNDQQREFHQKALDSVDQMTELVDHLLDLGRIEAGLGLKHEEIRAERIIDEVLKTYRPFAINKQISLGVEMQDKMEPITVDPTLVRQALANLVDNAISFTPANGHVTICAGQRGEVQWIKVEDTGVGIAPADQARLFEKFYRIRREQALDEEKPGLGLAIVKTIVEQHGGQVLVSSQLGTGSTFTIELPIHPKHSPLSRAEPSSAVDDPTP